MDRLTTNKPARDMTMTELALNCCYVGNDRWARYQDYDSDTDIRDFARELMRLYAPDDEIPQDNEDFEALLAESLSYGIDGDNAALVSLIYRLMWAMAELRQRLAAYEDTGLEPEEIQTFYKTISELSGELAKYKEAEEQGRLIVLPCKVGDTVYYAYDHRFVTEQKISRVSYTTGIGFEFFCDYNRYTRDYEFYFTPESIGRKVFCLREEAEAALGGNHDA